MLLSELTARRLAPTSEQTPCHADSRSRVAAAGHTALMREGEGAIPRQPRDGLPDTKHNISGQALLWQWPLWCLGFWQNVSATGIHSPQRADPLCLLFALFHSFFQPVRPLPSRPSCKR